MYKHYHIKNKKKNIKLLFRKDLVRVGFGKTLQIRYEDNALIILHILGLSEYTRGHDSPSPEEEKQDVYLHVSRTLQTGYVYGHVPGLKQPPNFGFLLELFISSDSWVSNSRRGLPAYVCLCVCLFDGS